MTPAPSTRVSEIELLVLESLEPYVAPDEHDLAVERMRVRLVAEVRRYRAMLIGLREAMPGDCPLHGQEWPAEYPCPEGCAWPALDAEVKAILAERKS